MVSGGVGTVWEKYTSIDKVMEQNEQLETENAELRQQLVDYDRIKAENEAYKALANIQKKNSNATYVSGFVIGRDPLDEFGGFTLDKGHRRRCGGEQCCYQRPRLSAGHGGGG